MAAGVTNGVDGEEDVGAERLAPGATAEVFVDGAHDLVPLVDEEPLQASQAIVSLGEGGVGLGGLGEAETLVRALHRIEGSLHDVSWEE